MGLRPCRVCAETAAWQEPHPGVCAKLKLRKASKFACKGKRKGFHRLIPRSSRLPAGSSRISRTGPAAQNCTVFMQNCPASCQSPRAIRRPMPRQGCRKFHLHKKYCICRDLRKAFRL